MCAGAPTRRTAAVAITVNYITVNYSACTRLPARPRPTILTLRITLRYAALRYATLLVAGCSSSPAAAARRSSLLLLRPSSSSASCVEFCSRGVEFGFASRCLLRFFVFLFAPPAAAPPAHIPE